MSDSLNYEIMRTEIFPLVKNQIIQRKESLATMDFKTFPCTGIEAWFKVEIVNALAETKHAVKTLNNTGPDLTLESEIRIELKGATDFVTSTLRKEAIKHKTFLMFLQNGSNKNKIEKISSYDDVDLVCHDYFFDGKNRWVIGVIKPTNILTP